MHWLVESAEAKTFARWFGWWGNDTDTDTVCALMFLTAAGAPFSYAGTADRERDLALRRTPPPFAPATR
jgi:hypothetical protein